MYKPRQGLLQSFHGAFRGLGCALKERNFFIQFVIGIAAVAASSVFDISRDEKIIIVLVVVLVLGAEMVNSSVERLLNRLAPREDREIAEIKEILAGAVLLFSLFSVAVGIIIFGPYIF